MSTVSKKICLVGDFGVGKTSLIRRFVDRQFSDQYLSTVGVKISRKLINGSNQDSVKSPRLQLLIWDIEGSTKFKAIAPTYLQGARGAVIVADVTRLETLAHLSDHVQQFLSVNPQGVAIVALNKADLLDDEQLNQLLQTEWFVHHARILGMHTTSAKTGKDVDQIFETLAHRLV
ncbi:MAG: GTP-binding protein [Cyanobacteria bacterium RU_5_0]|nr:GTP-binding protein [Cyanobacteria bacterium RU_5_0]